MRSLIFYICAAVFTNLVMFGPSLAFKPKLFHGLTRVLFSTSTIRNNQESTENQPKSSQITSESTSNSFATEEGGVISTSQPGDTRIPTIIPTNGATTTTPGSQPTCTGFLKCNPDIRKIAVSFLLAKMKKELNNADGLVTCSEETLGHILAKISPPVAPSVITSEVTRIQKRLDHSLTIEERELVSSILLENSIWVEAGETAVKELIYLDYLSSDDSCVSATSANILEASLKEDGSSVVKLSRSEAQQAMSLICTLNGVSESFQDCNSKALLKSKQKSAFFADEEKFEPYDNCGNPSLLLLLANRLRIAESIDNSVSSSLIPNA